MRVRIKTKLEDAERWENEDISVRFSRTRKRCIAFGAFQHVGLRSSHGLIRHASVSLFLQSQEIDLHDTIDASKKHSLLGLWLSPKETFLSATFL